MNTGYWLEVNRGGDSESNRVVYELIEEPNGTFRWYRQDHWDWTESRWTIAGAIRHADLYWRNTDDQRWDLVFHLPQERAVVEV